MELYLNRRERQLSQRRPLAGTQIICGDCAGDGLLPIKTFLTIEGRCAQCGGRSYELASILCGELSHVIRKIFHGRQSRA